MDVQIQVTILSKTGDEIPTKFEHALPSGSPVRILDDTPSKSTVKILIDAGEFKGREAIAARNTIRLAGDSRRPQGPMIHFAAAVLRFKIRMTSAFYGTCLADAWKMDGAACFLSNMIGGPHLNANQENDYGSQGQTSRHRAPSRGRVPPQCGCPSPSPGGSPPRNRRA
jgi:hypothetical protein